MHIDVIPIWLIFVATIVIVLAAIEAGYLFGRASRRRSENEKESPVGAIAGAILGLAGFTLAFTFSNVSNRYDARRALLREDAIAIRTAWQRADFLPQAERAETRGLLRDYVDLRVTFAQGKRLEPDLVRTFLAETQGIEDRLWSIAVANARIDPNTDLAAMYIGALNEMSAVQLSRVAVGIQARVPGEIWFVLYCITILGMMGVGYQTGIAASTRSMARPILALAFALVISLIASLDRPDSGVMRITQQPLIDLADFMATAESTSPPK